jgi:Flp pilus assembly protein TadG
MSRTHRRLVGRRGQSLVEFALVVPMLLLMVVGVIEFGRAWNISQVVTFAARQGARTAAVMNAQGKSVQEINDSIQSVVTQSLLSVNFPCNNCITAQGVAGGANEPVSVEVHVPYEFLIFGPVMALAGQSFDGAIELKSTAVMRNE